MKIDHPPTVALPKREVRVLPTMTETPVLPTDRIQRLRAGKRLASDLEWLRARTDSPFIPGSAHRVRLPLQVSRRPTR